MPKALEKLKTHSISLQLNHEEYEMLELIAQVMGENLSETLRSFIPIEMKNSFETQFKRDVKKNSRIRPAKKIKK